MKTVDEIHNKLYPQSSNEVETLCSHTSDNTCGVRSVATKRGIVKILHFRQFYKHFVFVEDADGGRKKLLKNYADVNVCIDMVCGDTKTDFERED